MIYKNWPSDARLDCKLIDGDKLAKFFVVEDTLLKENEDLLENVGYLENIKDSRQRFLMLDYLKWATCLLRFCTQLLYMTFLSYAHEDF